MDQLLLFGISWYETFIIQLLREPLWEVCTNLTFTYMIDREGHDNDMGDDNGEPKLFP